MNQKPYQHIYHANVNVDLMEENAIQINSGIMINVYVSVKNFMHVKKIMFGILLHVIVKMENIWQVLWMIQQLFVTKADDEEIKTIPTNFNENKATCKTKNFYILLAFLLITIGLLIAASIYCYLTKYRKQLLPFH